MGLQHAKDLSLETFHIQNSQDQAYRLRALLADLRPS